MQRVCLGKRHEAYEFKNLKRFQRPHAPLLAPLDARKDALGKALKPFRTSARPASVRSACVLSMLFRMRSSESCPPSAALTLWKEAGAWGVPHRACFFLYPLVPMPDSVLIARFKDELDTANFSDPDLNLTYADRQRLKEGNYAHVARERLDTLQRQLRWIRVNAVVAGLVLGFIGVLYALPVLTDAFSVIDTPFPAFYAACAGVGAIFSLWRARAMERKRVLCELVIAEAEQTEPSPAHAAA